MAPKALKIDRMSTRWSVDQCSVDKNGRVTITTPVCGAFDRSPLPPPPHDNKLNYCHRCTCVSRHFYMFRGLAAILVYANLVTFVYDDVRVAISVIGWR